MTEERLTEILEQHEHDRPCTCVAQLVAEVRRLQALVPPPGSIVVPNPCDRCLHDRVTHLDIGDMVCESPCDCPGFVPRGMEAPA